MTLVTSVPRDVEKHELLGLVTNNDGRRTGDREFEVTIYHRSGGAPVTRLNLAMADGWPAPKIGTRYKIRFEMEEPD